MPHGLGMGSSTLPVLQWQYLGWTPVPGPPMVPLGSCNMQPLLLDRTGSLWREEPHMTDRFLQNFFFFFFCQDKVHRCLPSLGKPVC